MAIFPVQTQRRRKYSSPAVLNKYLTWGLQLLLAQMAARCGSDNVRCCVTAIPDADEHRVRMVKTFREKREWVWIIILLESTSKS